MMLRLFSFLSMSAILADGSPLTWRVPTAYPTDSPPPFPSNNSAPTVAPTEMPTPTDMATSPPTGGYVSAAISITLPSNLSSSGLDMLDTYIQFTLSNTTGIPVDDIGVGHHVQNATYLYLYRHLSAEIKGKVSPRNRFYRPSSSPGVSPSVAQPSANPTVPTNPTNAPVVPTPSSVPSAAPIAPTPAPAYPTVAPTYHISWRVPSPKPSSTPYPAPTLVPTPSPITNPPSHQPTTSQPTVTGYTYPPTTSPPSSIPSSAYPTSTPTSSPTGPTNTPSAGPTGPTSWPTGSPTMPADFVGEEFVMTVAADGSRRRLLNVSGLTDVINGVFQDGSFQRVLTEQIMLHSVGGGIGGQLNNTVTIVSIQGINAAITVGSGNVPTPFPTDTPSPTSSTISDVTQDFITSVRYYPLIALIVIPFFILACILFRRRNREKDEGIPDVIPNPEEANKDKNDPRNKRISAPKVPVSSFNALGLKDTASIDEIKRTYKKLSFRFHPDRNKSSEAPQKFAEINEAYRVALHYKEASDFWNTNPYVTKNQNLDKNGLPSNCV